MLMLKLPKPDLLRLMGQRYVIFVVNLSLVGPRREFVDLSISLSFLPGLSGWSVVV